MEKELVGLFEAARKSADAAAGDGASSNGPEVARCIDALKLLRTFPVTKDALVSTQVGRKLRHLTKHPKEKIRTMAVDLLQLWKQVVVDETKKSQNNGSVDNTCSVKTEVSTKSESVKVEKLQRTNSVKVDSTKSARSETVKGESKSVNGVKAEKSETVKVEKTSREENPAASGLKKPSEAPTTPKISAMVKCNDAVRDKFRELLCEAFSKVASEADETLKDEVNASDPVRVAVSVESLMFEKLGKSTGNQKLKYRSILFNLKDQKNPDFRRRVLLGYIKPEMLITMTPEEMASDQRKEEIDKIKKKALFECERGAAPKATTDQFKCSRCGQRKTTYYQMQTRSADEPMTTYVTCVNCNNHWKFC